METYLYAPSTHGFYVPGLHTDIPSDAIEITAETHAALIDAQAKGRLIQPGDDGRPVAVERPPVPIANIKASMLVAIDAEAERQRLLWITPGAGQAMTYARKVDEAKAVQTAIAAGLEPTPDEVPMLAASIGIDGVDLPAVAATILAMDAAWGRVGGAIEARRLTLKQLIGTAEDAHAISAIDISAGWPALSEEQPE